MKNKLLYIHTQSIQPINSGGLNTTLLQVFSMCNSFARAGLEVTLAIERSGNFDRKLDIFIKRSFDKEVLFNIETWKQKTKNRMLNRIFIRSEIKNIVKKFHSDIIFTRDPYILNILIKVDSKIIYESHNARLHTKYDIIHNFLKNRVIKLSKYPNFKCLFSISESLSKFWYKEGVPKEKLFSWHDGFDHSLFNNYFDKTEQRKKLNLPLDKNIATYTGGLYKDRKIEDIILLAKEHPETYFLIIGGPKKQKKYYQNIAKNNSVSNINFIGFVDHNLIPKYLFASDILLALWSSKVPTIKYCSPLKLFEYMASGRLILAHSFPTIKEVLTDDVDAIFCKPDSIESLKTNFGFALSKIEDSSYGKAARKKAFNLYTWDMRASQLINFIDNHID